MIAGPSFLAPYRRRRRSSAGSTVPAAPAAPDTPSAPVPSDASTAYYTRLSWISARAAKADIYLDTVNPPATIVVPKYVGTSYVPTLLPSTTYYWKVVTFNEGGSATGPVWSFTTPAASAVLIALGGTIVTTHGQIPALGIHETNGPSPNHASLGFKGTVPIGGQAVQIGLGTLDDDDLLFAGEVQLLDHGYVGTPQNGEYPVDLVDQTFRLVKRRPFGTWVNVSASIIGRYLVAVFGSEYTANHIQDDLPAVSINFDGQADFMTCFAQLAAAISTFTATGHARVDYSRDVHLFIGASEGIPDPLTADHLPLNDPPIKFTVDHSQIRTRVFGKGHAETAPWDVVANETIVPIQDASMFSPVGGQAIAATIAGGAQTQILDYAGVQLGGGGSLVGLGAAPSAAPAVALVAGAGIDPGPHQYAYTDLTAAGESLPSPLASVTTGLTAAPASAPTTGAPTAGTGPDTGTHDYEVTFTTPSGETTPSPISSPQTTWAVADPAVAPVSLANDASLHHTNGGVPHGSTLDVGLIYIDSNGNTTATDTADILSIVPVYTAFGEIFDIDVVVNGVADAHVASIACATRCLDNSPTWYQQVGSVANPGAGNTTTVTITAYLTGTPAPGTSGAGAHVIPMTNIPLGGPTVTGRKLYRRFAGVGTFKLVAAIANNTTTTFSDTVLNASLGAAAPSSNTATANQVAVSGIAVGQATVTARKLYRTAAFATQLKLLTTIADNVTTIFADATPDASLGANAPVGDASGLTQPSGQVTAGSTSLITASAAPFFAAGGWAILSGGQAIRYTGIAANTLTGIPASGPGAITTSVTYGSAILPSPALTGVNHNNGLARAMAKGSSIAIWIQRDDLAAQAALGLLERDKNGNPTDGIREYTIIDGTRGIESLTAVCDADLAASSRPVVSTTYATLDRTHAGLTVSIDLSIGFYDYHFYDATFYDGDAWGLTGDFTIQSVDISFPNGIPRWSVKASSVAFTLSDLLRRAIIG